MTPQHQQRVCAVSFQNGGFGKLNAETTVLHVVADSREMRIFTAGDLQRAKVEREWVQDITAHISSSAESPFWRVVGDDALHDALVAITERRTYAAFASETVAGHATGAAHGRVFRALARAVGEGRLAVPGAQGAVLRAIDGGATAANAALVHADGSTTRLFVTTAGPAPQGAPGRSVKFVAAVNGKTNEPLDASMSFDRALAVLLDRDGELAYVWSFSKRELVDCGLIYGSVARTGTVKPRPYFHMPDSKSALAARCGVGLLKHPRVDSATFSRDDAYCAFAAQ